MHPKLVAVLACRARSTRLYAKPLQLVGNKPVLTHLIDRLKATPAVDSIALAISVGIENLVFADYAMQYGLEYTFGDELDVLPRVLRASRLAGADAILRLTTDCPFICMEVIGDMARAHFDMGADLTVMEGLPLGAFGEIINPFALERAYAIEEDKYKTAWITLFLKERQDLFHILRLEAPAGLARRDIRITVDYPRDLIVARSIYKALSKSGTELFTVREIIKFLDENPEVRKINSWIQPGVSRIWN
jgi:spore coat polysaccharide biosynthesis protein SpsF